MNNNCSYLGMRQYLRIDSFVVSYAFLGRFSQPSMLIVQFSLLRAKKNNTVKLYSRLPLQRGKPFKYSLMCPVIFIYEAEYILSIQSDPAFAGKMSSFGRIIQVLFHIHTG